MSKYNIEFDWQRSENIKIKQRGTQALIAASFMPNHQFKSSVKKYIWPSSFASGDTKVITRRISSSY